VAAPSLESSKFNPWVRHPLITLCHESFHVDPQASITGFQSNSRAIRRSQPSFGHVVLGNNQSVPPNTLLPQPLVVIGNQLGT